MNRILYNARCRCNEESPKKRKPNKKGPNPANILLYPDPEWSELRTFQINYEKKLSSVAIFLLNSFQDKYIYYAIDDILDSFKSNPTERDNLLAILYSPILSLQNNFSINFFDIWIDEISINELPKINKFLKNDNNSSNFKQSTYITIKLLYKLPLLPKSREALW